MASLHIMSCNQNFLFSAVLNRASTLLTSQRLVSRSVIIKLGLPEPPKRPGSAFTKFVQIQNPILRKKYPDSKQSDILKLAATLWKTADESVKTKLKQQCDSEVVAYKRKIEDYKETIKPHEEEILKEEQKESKKQHKKELKKLGIPKRPGNSYSLFVASQKDSMGNLSVAEFAKVVSVKWKALPDSEKAKYKLESDKNKLKYQKELENWQNQLNFAVMEKLTSKPKRTGESGKKKKET